MIQPNVSVNILTFLFNLNNMITKIGKIKLVIKNDILVFTSHLNDHNNKMTSHTIIGQYQHNKANNTEEIIKQVVGDKVKLHNNYIDHKLENITD